MKKLLAMFALVVSASAVADAEVAEYYSEHRVDNKTVCEYMDEYGGIITLTIDSYELCPDEIVLKD